MSVRQRGSSWPAGVTVKGLRRTATYTRKGKK